MTTNQANAIRFIPLWVDALKKQGAPDSVIPLIISQIILETAWFTSRAYKIDNNPAGITWNANYNSRPGTSTGIKRPANEGGNYVHYTDYDVAAKDLVRILNKLPGKPIEATTALQYANKLKANNFYTSSMIQYASDLTSINNRADQWANLAELVKKKASLNMASVSPLLLLLFLGLFMAKK